MLVLFGWELRPVGGGMRIFLHIAGDYVWLEPVLEHLPRLQKGHAPVGECAELVELLVPFASIVRRPCMLAAATLEAARHHLVDLVGAIALRFDLVVAKSLSERALVALLVSV